MILGRRAVLAGAGAAMAWPTLARAQTGAALDDAARLPPAEALGRLAGVMPVIRTEQLDLAVARAGLTVDAGLAQLGAPSRDMLKAWIAARAGARGLAADPDGARLYALLLRRQTGEIAVATAKRRLLAELVRLNRRADRLFARIGMRQGSVGARYAALWQDERQLYPDGEAGRAAAVRDMNAVLRRIAPVVPSLVGVQPEGPATIRALTPTEIAAGRSGYRILPAPAQAGTYVVDLRDIRRRPRWTLPGVVAHETLPGHLAQLPLEAAAPPHPLRLDYAAAFVEGWAIHAETLVAFPDPLDALGHLHWLLFRVARALADIGVHHHGWSTDETRARLLAWQGVPAYFAPWDTEVPRILREPATRAGEALSWLAIADAAARHRGAPRAAFHRQLLLNGRCRTENVGATDPR